MASSTGTGAANADTWAFDTFDDGSSRMYTVIMGWMRREVR
jgi:hypothetical protein